MKTILYIVKLLPGGLKSEKHLAEVVKDYDREAAEMRKPRNTSVESKISGPFVHNFRKKKPVNRKVFTFKGMQHTWCYTLYSGEQSVQ